MDEWKYVYREFSINGAADPHSHGKGGYGGILGIDPASYDKTLVGSEDGGVGLGVSGSGEGAVEEGMGKVKIVKAADLTVGDGAVGIKKEPPKGPATRVGKK